MTDALSWLRAHMTDAVRGRIHQIVPAVATLLVGIGYTTDTHATAWSALALVVADAMIASLHATSSFRAYLYPLLAAAAAVAVAYGLVDHTASSLILGVAFTVLGSGTALLHTPAPGPRTVAAVA